MEKGNLYLGPVGGGKTTRMKAEYDALKGGAKGWMTASDLTQVALRDGLLKIMELARHHYTIVFIDDIGHEPLTVTHFGTTFSPMAEFIQARYTQCQQEPMFSRQTYFTTNLTLDGLRERYGDFIVDRLIEMCEWVHMDGQSFRK